jgi:hypothetical protein
VLHLLEDYDGHFDDEAGQYCQMAGAGLVTGTAGYRRASHASAT